MKREIVTLLSSSAGQRVVMKTRAGGKLEVTRVFVTPVQLAFAPLVEKVARHGAGSTQGLPEELTLPLEGYRVRAGLGDMAGLPQILAAGVDQFAGIGIPPPPRGHGHAYVVTSWIEGTLVREARDHLDIKAKTGLLRGVLQLLGALHDRQVVYGDLKPLNIVIAAGQPWLIDLDTLRQTAGANSPVPTRDLTPACAAPEQIQQRLTYLASDVYAFGRLGTWLLEAELAAPRPDPECAAWRGLLTDCFPERPGARPSVKELLGRLNLAPGLGQTVQTVHVSDGTILGIPIPTPHVARKQPPAPAEALSTVIVADPAEASTSAASPPASAASAPRWDGRWKSWIKHRLLQPAVVVTLVATVLAAVAILIPSDKRTSNATGAGSGASAQLAPGTEAAALPPESIPAASECERLPTRQGSVINVVCQLRNPDDADLALRVTALLLPRDGAPITHHEQVNLRPRQETTVSFRFRDAPRDEGLSCRCEAQRTR